MQTFIKINQARRSDRYEAAQVASREAGFQRIHLDTEVPNAELVAEDTVYVPAAE